MLRALEELCNSHCACATVGWLPALGSECLHPCLSLFERLWARTEAEGLAGTSQFLWLDGLGHILYSQDSMKIYKVGHALLVLIGIGISSSLHEAERSGALREWTAGFIAIYVQRHQLRNIT